uniref:Probable chemoreceptor glutamine deamidase CheD n=1 Tax=Roseihalotalea indica TaxID=2867963 RepID=A0AA49JIT2_9BACT|nr:chemotaxis protein CheD [Tunicatimonas sp. TK19036]
MKADTKQLKPQSCFLKPAELIVSRYPSQITTVLGTCVSVCLFDPVTKIGGMNHYMLPFWEGKQGQLLKYGDVAIAALIEKMIKEGAQEKDIIAKVFGGVEGTNSIFRVGQKNIEVAVCLLKKKKIRIEAMEVGGRRGRKIRFSSWNHHVVVNFLKEDNGRK